jgi:RES domain
LFAFVATITRFNSFELSALPAGGIYRLTAWSRPLEPPRPPAPIGTVDPEHDSSGRWDAPNEEFSALYCATEAEGCFGEKLGQFIPAPESVLDIENFLEGSPDDEFADDDLSGGLSRAEVVSLQWRLAWAPTDADARIFDLTSNRTWLALVPSIAANLRAFGLPVNRAQLKSSRRGVTRRIAGRLYEAALDETGELRAHGLKYESWRPPAWECWALWEPLPLETDGAMIEDVTIDNPALRSAAAKLGVPLHA